MGGNYALDPDGFIWRARDKKVSKVDALTGNVVQSFKTKKFAEHLWQRDERGRPLFRRRRLAARRRRGRRHARPAKCSSPTRSPQFGPGARRVRSRRQLLGGRTRRHAGEVRHQRSASSNTRCRRPTPRSTAPMADKNGEVWAGEMHGGRYARFNPKTEQWTRIRAARALRHRPRSPGSTIPPTR